MTWNECQQWEASWHGDCVGTEFGERMKQTVYASRMGLRFEHDGKSPFSLDCDGKSILDIGGGPYSMLLFCKNVHGTVIDPCEYPQWVMDRYQFAGITVLQMPAEELKVSIGYKGFEICLIYNVLQHVQNPGKVISNARHLAKEIRIFEWVNCGTSDGHPNELTPEGLDSWLGGEGKIENINEKGCCGLCYYGVFKGDSFETNRFQERLQTLEQGPKDGHFGDGREETYRREPSKDVREQSSILEGKELLQTSSTEPKH